MKAVTIFTEDGQCAAVLGEAGRIYTPYVMVEFPIRKRRIFNVDVPKYTRPLFIGKGNDPYPMKRIVRHLRRIGKHHGITKGATQLLKGGA
jgi:hypothetical protein